MTFESTEEALQPVPQLYVIRCRSNPEAHAAPAFYDAVTARKWAKRANAGTSCPAVDHQVDVYVPSGQRLDLSGDGDDGAVEEV